MTMGMMMPEPDPVPYNTGKNADQVRQRERTQGEPPKPPNPPEYSGSGEREWGKGGESIPDFMRRMTGGMRGVPFEQTKLFAGSDSSKEADLFADIYWSTIISETGLFLAINGIPDLNKNSLRDFPRGSKIFIVKYEVQGSYRRDLLILVPTYMSKPVVAQLHPIIDLPGYSEVLRGAPGPLASLSIRSILKFRLGLFDHPIKQFILSGDHTDFSDFHHEIGSAIVVAPMPPLELHAEIPSPALSVANSIGATPKSTVGVVANNGTDEGVTVAYHALASRSTSGYVGQRVEIGGHVGTVLSIDAISDSAFVKLDDGVGHIATNIYSSVRRGPAPGLGMRAEFDGCGSGRSKSTRIVATPPTLLMSHHPAVQRHVLTSPDSLPGDSGCALVDDEGQLTGFCLGSSGAASAQTFSIWIYADSVFQAHNLT